jgi:phosphatidylglycerophosphate synthase
MLSENRKKFDIISEKIGEIFSKTGISPNAFTLLSLFFAFLSFIFLIKENLILAPLFFVIASILDLIDGAVAKFKNQTTKKGAYLDTICDRYVEGIIIFGFLFLDLPRIIFIPEIWIFLCLFGALMTTYSKAAAKEKEVITDELKRGFMERPERIILIFLALILGNFSFLFTVYTLIILAIFSNITALQRIFYTLTM